MKKILLLVTLVFASISSYCCSCYNDIEEMNISRYNDHDAIFIARVDSVGTCQNTYPVYLKISRIYKGTPDSIVKIVDVDCKSECALNFSKESEYLIYAFANKDNTAFKITPCNGTRRILNADEIKQVKANSEKFNNRTYLDNEIKRWEHEIEMLEKISSKTSGNIKTTFINGKPTGNGKFQNGHPHGEWTYYYPDGNVKASGHYTDGKREGKWIEYSVFYNTFEGDVNLNGNNRKKYLVKSSGIYKNGLKEGRWERINVDGTVNVLYFKNGKFTGEEVTQFNKN